MPELVVVVVVVVVVVEEECSSVTAVVHWVQKVKALNKV
jgi:hypothetical protein